MAVSNKPGDRESEYGGVSGIIQPASKGHSSLASSNADRRAVQEEAMVVRSTMRKEANGLLKSLSEVRNEDGTITINKEYFTEEDVRGELGGNR